MAQAVNGHLHKILHLSVDKFSTRSDKHSGALKENADVFNIFKRKHRRSSQISSQPILDRGIDAMVMQRNAHLAEMNRLEAVIAEATRAYDQHTRLYDALNNSLFAINHPFTDADAADMGNAFEAALAADFDPPADFDADLSVDQPSDGERLDAAEVAVRNAEEAAAMAGFVPPVIPLRGGKRRKATAAEAAE